MEYVYASMLIHKLGGKIDEGNIQKVVQAAGGNPDQGKVRALVSALQDIDIDKVIKEASLPVAVAAPSTGGAEAKKEEKPKEEEKKVDASVGLGALFG